MNSVTDVATVTVAVVAILGAVVAIAAWFYRRGAQERGHAKALEANTEATLTLAAELKDFKILTIEKLHEMDIRLTRVETRK